MKKHPVSSSTYHSEVISNYPKLSNRQKKPIPHNLWDSPQLQIGRSAWKGQILAIFIVGSNATALTICWSDLGGFWNPFWCPGTLCGTDQVWDDIHQHILFVNIWKLIPFTVSAHKSMFLDTKLVGAGLRLELMNLDLGGCNVWPFSSSATNFRLHSPGWNEILSMTDILKQTLLQN